MVQYKIFSTLGLLGAAVDYVGFGDMKPYDLWVNAVWPEFFAPNDKKDMPGRFPFLLQPDSEIEQFVLQEPSFFYQKANEHPDFMLALCDPTQHYTALALLRSLQDELEEYRVKEQQKQAIVAFMQGEVEERELMLAEEQVLRTPTTTEELKARKAALLPPVYTLIPSTPIEGKISPEVGNLASVIATKFMLDGRIVMPRSIEGIISRAQDSSFQTLDGLRVLSDKMADSVDEALNHLGKQQAVILEHTNGNVAVIKGSDDKICLFTPSLQKAINEGDTVHLQKPVVMMFDSAKDAKKALRAIMPTMTSYTFYEKTN